MGNHVYSNLPAENLSDPITELALDLRHLRWDLTAMFEMAMAEKVIEANPATRLYTPKQAPEGRTRAMSVEEVRAALDAVELREQALLHMAILGTAAGRNTRVAAAPHLDRCDRGESGAARGPR